MGDPRPAARSDRAIGAPATFEGEALARAFAGGAEALRRATADHPATHVFPVPDGDTGTNMSLTMRAAVEEVARAPQATARDVATAAASGALMGAKGNSGVILSQILAGIADMPIGADTLDARELATSLDRARTAAYNVVSAPKEGTILSAIAASARAALVAADAGDDALATFAAAVDACSDAVARTPEQLPVLKEAGVVDAGAQGLFVLLDGMLRALRGDEQTGAIDAGAIDPSWLSATRQMHGGHEAQAGFCTEYVITGEALDPDTTRRRLGEIGDSVLAVGGGDLVRVHVHTKQPDDALAYGRTLGTVSHEKVDDMEAQFQALASRNGARASDAPTTALAVVAVAPGDGIDALFRSMGAAAIVRGGQTMNPSAGDIRAAIDATGARDVIVLPNNKNVVLAAKQAASGAAARVHVIETRSIPHGVAALVALNTDETFDENVTQMSDALANVHSAEVTLAARATTLNGIAIREGQPIGIVDGELAVAEETLVATVIACVRSMVSDPAEAIVTLYAGEAHSAAETDDIAAKLRDDPGIEIELVDGGQPHYPYLIGVE